MKRFLLLITIVFLGFSASAYSTERDSTLMKYVDTVKVNKNNFDALFKTVTKPGINNTEKLTLFYYWVYRNFTFDIDAFVNNTDHQTLEQSLISQKGLCYEYNNLLDAACKELKIPGANIEGYVKYYQFAAGQTFNEANHVWHAVNIDNKWMVVDLLWACGELHIRNGKYIFKKKLNEKYFLAEPHTFLNTHLPLDPIWQFEERPLTMTGFTSKAEGIDSSLVEGRINYPDSIAKMNTLSSNNKAIAAAIRAYNFNTNNPDILITTYYNVAVELIDKKSPTKTNLIQAKKYLIRAKTMMSKTTNQAVLQLAPECDRGIKVSDSKLKFLK